MKMMKTLRLARLVGPALCIAGHDEKRPVGTKELKLAAFTMVFQSF